MQDDKLATRPVEDRESPAVDPRGFKCKGDEVAQYAIERRGYVVLGFLAGVTLPLIGDRLWHFTTMSLSQPLVVVSATDEADWIEQGRVLVNRFRQDMSVPRCPAVKGHGYFRAMTD